MDPDDAVNGAIDFNGACFKSTVIQSGDPLWSYDQIPVCKLLRKSFSLIKMLFPVHMAIDFALATFN